MDIAVSRVSVDFVEGIGGMGGIGGIGGSESVRRAGKGGYSEKGRKIYYYVYNARVSVGG
jgi:hypothetical protein